MYSFHNSIGFACYVHINKLIDMNPHIHTIYILQLLFIICAVFFLLPINPLSFLSKKLYFKIDYRHQYTESLNT